MTLFKRIFDFPRATLARLRNKRRAARYPVAGTLPLKFSVHLGARAGSSPGMAWGGQVADLSATGLRLRLPPAAEARRGEQAQLALSLEDFQLLIPCTVAHFRTGSATAVCGLALQFADEDQARGYAQLLEAVVIGAGFVPDKPAKAKDGLAPERYRSERRAVLTAWRHQADKSLHAFECAVGPHAVRGLAGEPALEVIARGAICPAGAERQEILRLFRIVSANLPKAVPADLRHCLQAAGPRPPAAAARSGY